MPYFHMRQQYITSVECLDHLDLLVFFLSWCHRLFYDLLMGKDLQPVIIDMDEDLVHYLQHSVNDLVKKFLLHHKLNVSQ